MQADYDKSPIYGNQAADVMRRRILFLARHFPPVLTGGTRRNFLLARGLADRGHDVFVAAPRAPVGFDGVGVAHPQETPSTEPSPARRSLRDAARAKLLLPDPDIRWSLRLRAAVLAHDAPPPDWVISSSPPESLHVAAWSLARRYGARWLADFRDHWIENPLRPERRDAPARALVERGIARALLAQVDAASAVDAPIAEELRRYAPSASIAIIGHFAEAPTRRVDLPGETVNLAHTGSFTLSDPDRRIGPLLSAFEKARKREPRLALHLVGRLTDDERAAAQGSPAASAIRLHGVVDYEQARGFQAAADGLVLAIAEGQHGVPGKYAEYGLSGKPVVVLQGGTLMDIAEGALTPSGGLDAAAERLASVADARPASQAGLTLDEAIDRWETLMALR